jgi:hypothetical protein
MGFTSFMGEVEIWHKQKADPSRMAPGLLVSCWFSHAPSYGKNASDMVVTTTFIRLEVISV